MDNQDSASDTSEDWDEERLESAEVLSPVQLDSQAQQPYLIAGIATGEEEQVDTPEVEALRNRIHQLYDDIVLCKTINPDPPVRGPCGYAEIKFKPGYEPMKARPIVLFR